MEKRVQELRWNPLLKQWVMVSSLRERRPWRPVRCPFCPGSREMGYYRGVKLVENKYPMLSPKPLEPTKHYFYKTGMSRGKSLVLVETHIHDLDDLSDLELKDIVDVIEAVKSIVNESIMEGYKYVFWFRNKGEEIGVSLTHPHSQIYVMDFIPFNVQLELDSINEYRVNKGKCLICDILNVEYEDKDRIVYGNDSWIAFIPFFARWPFEVHIYPKRHLDIITKLSKSETWGLADSLKKVLCGLKTLFEKPMPYMLALHQAPLIEGYSHYHLHLEIYGVYRSNGKLKYAAGMESAGGNFTYDSTPELNALMLRRAVDRCR